MAARQVPYYSQPSLGWKDPDKSTLYRYVQDAFQGVGQDSFSSPPAQNEDMYEVCSDVMPPVRGSWFPRWGYTKFAAFTTFTPSLAFVYQKDSTLQRNIVWSSTAKVVVTDETGTVTNSSLFVPAGGASTPRMVLSRDYGYFADLIANDQKKWNGASGLSKWGIVAPASAIAVSPPINAGNITVNSGRKYYCVYQNSTTGHTSDLNPVSPTTGPLASQNIQLSAIPVSADAQVDFKLLLATADGGDETTLYLLTTLANAATTFTDNIDELTLLAGNIYLETDAIGVEHGVSDNTPPPNGYYPTKHRGRLYLVQGQTLWFSKSLDELTTSTGTIVGKYEESWPGDYQLDISEAAETVRGLKSDGVSLWIGSQKCVRRLDGSGPLDFSKPEITFNDIGLLNQDVWEIVYRDGQPVGTIWVTPDFQVIQSDFTNYTNIGAPIQDVLNSINVSAAGTSHAKYVHSGEFNLYTLYVPTGSATLPNTVLVFDLISSRWYTWTPADSITCSLFNTNASGVPQWLFGANTNFSYFWDRTTLQDRFNNTPVNQSTPTLQTSWLSLGDATVRKSLNELEVISSAPTALAVTLSGTNDFVTNTSIVSATNPTASPLGPFKIMLAGQPSKHRFYKLRFTAPASSFSVGSQFLQSFSLEIAPLHRV